MGLGCLWLIERLPTPAIMGTGRLIGRLMRRLPIRWVPIARRNIELCLPELSSEQREQLLRKHFEALGMCLCESAMAWWSADERLRRLAHIEGLEHLQAALAKGKGAVLLTAHFTTLEIGARVLNESFPINALYRPPKNKLMAEIMHRRRGSKTKRLIQRDDVRAMVRALKDNEVVWYAPDQSYRKKGAAMVNFFGIPAATNTFTSRLAQMTGASVLLFSHERLPDNAGWRVVVHPPLQGFPSGDPIADTERFHHFIEAEVRRIPAQYWWIHRRFKGLSADYPNYYGANAQPSHAVREATLQSPQ
jgi:KDO2-lipid IV(A) lauroyltransferase